MKLNNWPRPRMFNTNRFSTPTLFGAITFLAIGAGISLIVGLIILGVNDLDDWKTWCTTEAHGHVIDHTTTSTGTGVGSNGKPVVTVHSDTTYYCLNETGGIIDIYG